jgi:hypothetical protein
MNAPQITPEQAKSLCAERERLIYDTVALKPTDHVPIILFSMFWHARYAGMTIRQAMYDYDALGAALRRAVVELQPDAFVPAHQLGAIGPTMELMGYRQLKWPGNGTGDESPYQYIDREYMTAGEYDDYIEDPSYFCITKLLPRVADAFGPLAGLPQYAGIMHLRLIHSTRAFRDPAFASGIERLAKAGDEMERAFASSARVHEELAALGFPIGQGPSSHAPYDYFSDYMRGSKGAMLDMFRRKDKLLEAMERCIPIITRAAIAAGSVHPCKLVFFPMHWGLDGFMSPAQFKTFFWPQLRRVLMGVIEAGLVPLVLWEGDCTSRLETIADIPRGKAIYWFERTDLAHAKAVLGDIVCLRGNVPPSMLNMGTPDEVREYCRNLIKIAGKNGGFILDGGIGIPDEARAENVRAMYAAVRDFGKYT